MNHTSKVVKNQNNKMSISKHKSDKNHDQIIY